VLNKTLIILLAFCSGLGYFVLELGYAVLGGLFVVTIFTRFSQRWRNVGKFAEMLLVYCGLSTLMNELGIAYPYSLVLILTGLMALIFYEGPEWSALYFGFGKTPSYFKMSLGAGIAMGALFGVWLYTDAAAIRNPVPAGWPLDVLVLMAVGFAFYIAIMEEIIFRSFLLERATAAAGKDAAIISQAMFYGMIFYRIPVSGSVAGVVVGTVLGLLMGWLVRKTDSIYLAVFVHFVVALIVFVELALLG